MENHKSAGAFTRQEILSQPAAWSAALEMLSPQAVALREFYARGEYGSVYFTGCGSTYYLALAAAAVFQELTGVVARGLPASEIWLYPGAIPRRHGKARFGQVGQIDDLQDIGIELPKYVGTPTNLCREGTLVVCRSCTGRSGFVQFCSRSAPASPGPPANSG